MQQTVFTLYQCILYHIYIIYIIVYKNMYIRLSMHIYRFQEHYSMCELLREKARWNKIFSWKNKCNFTECALYFPVPMTLLVNLKTYRYSTRLHVCHCDDMSTEITCTNVPSRWGIMKSSQWNFPIRFL